MNFIYLYPTGPGETDETFGPALLGSGPPVPDWASLQAQIALDGINSVFPNCKVNSENNTGDLTQHELLEPLVKIHLGTR